MNKAAIFFEIVGNIFNIKDDGRVDEREADDQKGVKTNVKRPAWRKQELQRLSATPVNCHRWRQMPSLAAGEDDDAKIGGITPDGFSFSGK